MPITVFNDVIVPTVVLRAGVNGKNMRHNSRVPTDNGFESINIVWTQTLREYTFGVVPLSLTQWQSIETLHEITEGGAYGVLLLDPKDQTVTNGVMTLVSAGVYQLHKRYVHGPSTRFKTRKITRPIAASFMPVASGLAIAPANYTLDTTTGLVTIPSNPSAATLSWTGGFYVPVHFMQDSIDFDLVVSGPVDGRYIAGPTVVLQEIRE